MLKLVVMTCAITSTTMAAGTSQLLRCVDGVELPIAGTWTVDRNHGAVNFFVPRRLRRPDSRVGRAHQATLAFSDDPGQVLVAVLFDAPDLQLSRSQTAVIGAPIHLEARSVPGPHRWALSGEVFTDISASPLRASLSYHGVWRRGDRSHGWFGLAGTIDPPPGGSQRRLRFSFELLARRPDVEPRQVPAPSRSHFVRMASPTYGAA